MGTASADAKMHGNIGTAFSHAAVSAGLSCSESVGANNYRQILLFAGLH